MFDQVEYVRAICSDRKIAIATLEKDLGFANGYLNPKKIKKIPYERAVKIAEYLGISLSYLLTGEEKTPAENGERVSDNDIKFALFGTTDIDDDLFEDVKALARTAAEQAEKRKKRK